MKDIRFDESVAGVLLNDTVAAGQMRKMLSNLETSSTGLEKLVAELHGVVLDIEEGEGAANYLLKDTVLVNRFENTMLNVEEGVEKFNENMEAMKHNFLTRGYFRKLERQQKKAEKQNAQNN